MPLIAKDNGGGDFTPVPEGTHLAICNMVADLGLQQTQGQFASVKHQVFIRWELPNERIEWTDKDGNKNAGPMVIGKTYTLSLSEKANLRKDLQAWRGKAFTDDELKGFDVFKLLGVGCQVTVVHKSNEGKTYANVASVAGWPKGMPRPTATESPLIKYSVDEPKQYADLPDWLREKISKQVDPKQPPAQQQGDPGPSHDDGGHDLDESVPF